MPEPPPASVSRSPRLPLFRKVVQTGFLLYCLWIGYRFFLFFSWAAGHSPRYAARPPSVEGFLPISGLMGLKRLLLTGLYDPVHPAGLSLLISALVLAVLSRKGFCGWICPVGALSNLLERLAQRLRLLRRPPGWLDYPLLSLKYFLLAFFGYLILWQMTLPALDAFLQSPYNLTADARMLQFFLAPSGLTLAVLLFLVVFSVLARNFWCRYACPYGALLGLAALVGPWRLKREGSSCTGCRRCEQVCPASLPIAGRQTIWQPECIGCGECVAACPQPRTLQLCLGRRVMPVWLLPLLVLGLFFLIYAVAAGSGHWTSKIPEEVFRKLYTAFWG